MLKIAAAIVAALGLGLTGAYFGTAGKCSDGSCPISRLLHGDTTATTDCCTEGSDCCTPPQACCGEAKTAKKGCCASGGSCCEPATEQVKAEKPDCCFPGSPCCDGGDCCPKKAAK
jgi:hypothetical protein